MAEFVHALPKRSIYFDIPKNVKNIDRSHVFNLQVVNEQYDTPCRPQH